MRMLVSCRFKNPWRFFYARTLILRGSFFLFPLFLVRAPSISSCSTGTCISEFTKNPDTNVGVQISYWTHAQALLRTSEGFIASDPLNSWFQTMDSWRNYSSTWPVFPWINMDGPRFKSATLWRISGSRGRSFGRSSKKIRSKPSWTVSPPIYQVRKAFFQWQSRNEEGYGSKEKTIRISHVDGRRSII